MTSDNIEYLDCDVIVVGSGATGSQAAQAAAEEGLKVIVISKDPMSSSDTKICEDYFFKCEILKRCNAYCLDDYLTKYRLRNNSLQSNSFRNFYLYL